MLRLVAPSIYSGAPTVPGTRILRPFAVLKYLKYCRAPFRRSGHEYTAVRLIRILYHLGYNIQQLDKGSRKNRLDAQYHWAVTQSLVIRLLVMVSIKKTVIDAGAAEIRAMAAGLHQRLQLLDLTPKGGSL